MTPATMAGDEAHDAEIRGSAEAAEGEPSSSDRDVVELSDGEDGSAARAPGALRETRVTKRQRASGVVDLTADSDGDEPPAVGVQYVTVLDSPPRPPPALLSHIKCAICMDTVGACTGVDTGVTFALPKERSPALAHFYGERGFHSGG